ncbi:DUF58 domain-containing protein [Stieleria mannarensis]|uniref:DUF58 domain-containing protein n=1 Tax=Stieleria mannarensis TaxID=2755585 RepID=UPI0016008A4B|nr:DUF58 domain-containing protein [Rhodopirellula sp. JC639]
MAIVHGAPEDKRWAVRLLTTDFCPWANRFVYWLKEPVGWFVLATAASVIVGMYFAPIGWTMAVTLVSVIAIGMLWPAIAVRVVACSLTAAQEQVHEDESCELRLAVRNRLPLPVWGLAIEGFLDRSNQSDDHTDVPTVALAFVRALATSTYRFSIRPQLRGRYPDGDAVLTCSFPFGIWTAKRKLNDLSPITVWPKIFPITGQTAMTGRRVAETGQGNRVGRTGDFIGVREYRQGDCLRQVNWIATARSGELVVTERSGPQCPGVHLIVDVNQESQNPAELSDRIRVAASVMANLHQAAVPLQLHVGDRRIHVRRGWEGFVQMMDALADVPADGCVDSPTAIPARGHASIMISSDNHGDVTVCICDPSQNRRLSDGHTHRLICRDRDLATQCLSFWTEVRDATLVA